MFVIEWNLARYLGKNCYVRKWKKRYRKFDHSGTLREQELVEERHSALGDGSTNFLSLSAVFMATAVVNKEKHQPLPWCRIWAFFNRTTKEHHEKESSLKHSTWQKGLPYKVQWNTKNEVDWNGHTVTIKILSLAWCRSDSNCELFIAETWKNVLAAKFADL